MKQAVLPTSHNRHRIDTCAALFAALCLLYAQVDAAADLVGAELTGLALSLVKVEAIDADGRRWLGTGVGVAPEHVVTSCHITRSAERILVQYRGQRRAVTVQSPDTEHDLCLLEVPGLTAQPVTLGTSRALSVGAPVSAIGFEGGASLHARAGVGARCTPTMGRASSSPRRPSLPARAAARCSTPRVGWWEY